MKQLCMACALVLFSLKGLSQHVYYPTYEEISEQLNSYESQYPDIAKVEVLGFDEETSSYEILALKISDNASESEDEPAWVFTGIIHGTEIVGVQVILDLAERLLGSYGSDFGINRIVDNYEIWLIPDMNPYGTNYNPFGPEFRYYAGLRKNAEESGVDLNRNWDFRHDQGGSTNPESYEYRGIEAFSESETKAIRDFYLREKPVFGLTFHRGNEDDGGQILRPWGGEIGSPPDAERIDHYAYALRDWVMDSREDGDFCDEIEDGVFALEDPNGVECETGSESTNIYCKSLCWEPVVLTLAPFGQSSNWAYASAGTLDYTVEVSDKNFSKEFMFYGEEPETEEDIIHSEIIKEHTRNWSDAIIDWFNYFGNGFQNWQFRGPGITGVTINELGEPIEATISIAGFESEFTDTRESNEGFGRYLRLLPIGNYVVTFQADGYDPVVRNINISEGNLSTLDVQFGITLSSAKIDSELNIFPNPVSEKLIIVLDEEPNANYSIILRNLEGKNIIDLEGFERKTILDVQHLESGLYIVELYVSNKKILRKVLVD